MDVPATRLRVRQQRRESESQEYRVRQLLERERSRLLKRLDALGALAAEYEQPRRGFAGDGEDLVEAAMMAVERGEGLTLGARLRQSLTQVELALARLEAGLYGICHQCGRRIGGARLKAMPHAILCIRCQASHEQVGTARRLLPLPT
ncbi:MAG: TraR/DksA family transcriptional regulator [Armatimonadota bacterium]|nr:TraR/DksA family transcriptional regulator [Armatimonadota bacterium]